MATRPVFPPEPDPNRKKTEPTGATEKSVKQPVLQMTRNVSKRSDLQNYFQAVMRKRWLRIAGITVAVFLLILIAVPFLIDVNSFRPTIESEASAALGREVTVGNLSLSILSGGVRIEDIVVADDPAFSKTPFVTATSLKVGVELIPLIFSKQINVTQVTLEKPLIALVKTPDGRWNFSTIGGGAGPKTAESSGPGESTPPNFSVAKLNVNHGTLSVGNANSSAKPAIYDNVNISVEDFSFTSPFTFKLSAQLPGSGDLKISGKGGPINPDDAAKTPLATTVKVNNMSIGALGLIAPGAGIGGLASFDGTLNSDGSQAKAVGLFTGKQLKFSPKGTPAPKTVIVRHAVNFDVGKHSGSIAQGDISIGSAQAHLTGTFQGRGETLVVNLKLDAPSMPVDELQPMLPSVGVVLPSGSQLKGGTLSANLEISGPIDKTVVSGPVRLSNTQLANFNLGAQLGALSSFAGKAVSDPNTSIQNASLVARVAPEGMKADNIYLDVPAIGVITGAGTVSPAGELAFKMLANLKGGMVGGLSKVAGAASGQGGIPFAITGTTSDPKFVPDVGGVVTGLATAGVGNLTKGQVPGVKNVSKGLGGILGKKNQ